MNTISKKEKQNKRERIFVYGTLKKGFCLHSELEDSKFVKNGWLYGYSMYKIGSIPTVERSNNAWDKIFGEIYLVDSGTLQTIDSVEGHPFSYKRTWVNQLGGVWVYLEANMNPSYYKNKIKNGMYI